MPEIYSETLNEVTEVRESEAGRCPVDHSAWTQQKTARTVEPVGPAIERDGDGVWHVRGFEEARAVLRSGDTRQAGFNAEKIGGMGVNMAPPILYQDGKSHQQQRRQTARFFTPKAVSTNYRQLMEKLSDRLVARVQRKKQLDLSKLSLEMAVLVAGQVIGLTDSRLPGMTQRLEAFFEEDITSLNKWNPKTLLTLLRVQYAVTLFLMLDVKPAIKARKRSLAQGKPAEDLIGHLVQQGAKDIEILTECITFGAAGMVTTREFISVVTWHMLEHPELRARYLQASEKERHAMLEELLRLEPVVGHLYRRTSNDLELESAGEKVTIPAGALIDVHIYGANADESIVGEQPLAMCPGRELGGDRVPAAMMSFGDGHHRCPGSYIAIQETDIFLQRLLKVEGLHIVREPHLRFNDLVTGYELRKFMIAV